ncbi:MAG: DUF3135 domain-containing protein [Gammaproteobacteria bacterium]
MHQNDNSKFDFHEWARLAREEPEKFETLRRGMIDEVIESAPPGFKHRMVGLQWQIDQICLTSANPMASCLRISKMMWDSVLGENGLMDSMEQLAQPAAIHTRKTVEKANIIEFKPDKKPDSP